jgi:CRISPR-associated protein Cmr5
MANVTQRQKLEQGRADFAFKRATTGYNSHRKEYASAVQKLPMMIKTNGLGATIAFMFSKGKTLATVLNDIEDWVNSPDNLKTHLILKNTEGGALVQKILNLNSQDYRIVTIEVLAFLNWLRRFAEGIVKQHAPKTNP